jgi:hypothetical protein
MSRPILLALALALALPGCAQIAQSRFNPLNWFGPATATPADPADLRPLVPAGRATPLDSRTLIGTVTALTIDATADGAIVRATGLAPTRGFYNAELVLTDSTGGALTYEFRVSAPSGPRTTGPAQGRTITVARMLSRAELASISAIRVLGATNAQDLRR